MAAGSETMSLTSRLTPYWHPRACLFHKATESSPMIWPTAECSRTSRLRKTAAFIATTGHLPNSLRQIPRGDACLAPQCLTSDKQQPQITQITQIKDN